MQMEEPYYANIEYIDYQYFPVVPEDYTGTSDRPNCEIPKHAVHYPAQVGLSCEQIVAHVHCGGCPAAICVRC